MKRLALIAALLSIGSCFYIPTERFRCGSDFDCRAIGGTCDLASETCITGGTDASTGLVDGGTRDASIRDGAVPDAAVPDAATSDAGPPDGSAGDAAATDAGATDGGTAACGLPLGDGGNSKPIVQPDIARGLEDTSIVVDVLANDCDPDGDVLSIASVTGQGASRVSVVSGRIKYSPPPDDFSTAIFNYLADDGRGGATAGTVEIRVESINDPPQVQDQRLEYRASTLLGQLTGIDRDGDPIRFLLAAQPEHGIVTIDEDDGSFSYTLRTDGGAPPGFDFFTFQAEDPNGLLSPLGRVDILIAATVEYDVIWEGGTLNALDDWEEPLNWSTDAVPQPGDQVLIPAGTFAPQLATATEIGGLLVETGARLSLVDDAMVTVHGDTLAMGSIDGVGTVSVDGHLARVAGQFPILQIHGETLLAGPTTVARELTVTAPVSLGGWTLDVGGALLVSGTGSLAMQQVTDRLIAHSAATFSGADATGLATNGVLELHGLLHVVDEGLMASGDHLTLFAGTATTLRVDGYLAELSNIRVLGGRLQVVQASNGLPGVVTVVGGVELSGNAILDGDDGLVLNIKGDLKTGPLSVVAIPVLYLRSASGTALIEGVMQADTVIMSGDAEQTLSSRISYNNVWVQGPLVIQPQTSIAQLQVSGLTARVVMTGLVTVGGIETGLSTSLVMQTEEAHLKVLGDADLEGAQAQGLMSAGTIEVQRNLSVTSSGINATGTHRLVLGNPADTERQSFRVNDTSSQGRINDVELLNPIGTDITSRLKVYGDFAVNCGSCSVDARSSPGVQLLGPFEKNAGSTAEFSSLTLSHPTGTTLLPDGLSAQTLTLAGTGQTLNAALAYTNVTITADGVVTDGAASIAGTLLIDSPASAPPATLRLGGPLSAGAVTVKDSAVLHAEGHRIDIAGALRTENGGTIEMRTTSDFLVANGDATLHGDNSDPLKTNGTLEAHGRLDLQSGAFTPAATHRVVIPAVADGGQQEVVLGDNASLMDVDVLGAARFSRSGDVHGTLNVAGFLRVDELVNLTVGRLSVGDAGVIENFGSIDAGTCELPSGFTPTGIACGN